MTLVIISATPTRALFASGSSLTTSSTSSLGLVTSEITPTLADTSALTVVAGLALAAAGGCVDAFWTGTATAARAPGGGGTLGGAESLGRLAADMVWITGNTGHVTFATGWAGCTEQICTSAPASASTFLRCERGGWRSGAAFRWLEVQRCKVGARTYG